MKFLLITLFFPIMSFANVPAKDITLDYNVTEMKCVTDSGEIPCEETYFAVKLTTMNADNQVLLEVQVSQNGSTNTWFLENEAIDKSKRTTLSYDNELKRLVYTRSSEIWETNPDFVIDTVSANIQFYQITNTTAVLVEGYVMVKSDGTVLNATITAKLTKK